MDLLWGGQGRAARGPKPALTLERIVDEATRIADVHGLPSVTMQTVAERLDVTTMALYRYVSSKSELIDAMVEAALGKPPTMDPKLDWREKLVAWARGNLAIYQRHPWVLYAVISSPPFGPNQMGWFESALDAVATLDTTTSEKLAIIEMVDDHVRGAAQLLMTVASTPQFGEWYARAVQLASADGRYPRIADLVASGAFSGPGEPDWDQFEFGLDRILDGIDHFTKTPHRSRRIGPPSRKPRSK